MYIYSALVIPFLAIGLALIFHHHKVKWWEAIIPFAVALVCIVVSKAIAEDLATRSYEYWGGWTVSAHYFEDWNEYVHKTCTDTHCSGSGKDRTCYTTIRDCSYVDYHPENWALLDSNGQTHSISEAAYTALKKRLGTSPQFVDMHRRYHTNDGDQYKVLWSGQDTNVVPIFTKHNYENRVAASRSVFNYKKVSSDEALKLGLFAYPENVDLFNFPSVLGSCGQDTARINTKLSFYNAKLGRIKQLRMWVICLPSADPSIGREQEAYWTGGNKNEVVVIRGTGWTHVFSWTDDKTPVINIRDFSASHELSATVDFMAEELNKSFVRKQFEDFSYLTIDTPLWCIVIAWILTLLTSGATTWWVIHNDFSDESKRRH